MAELKITPLHPALGAEVAGVDLSVPMDEPTRHALSRALADHLALVFRGQSLTPAQYLAAASVFGPPMEQHYSQHNMPDHPLIGLYRGGGGGTAALVPHGRGKGRRFREGAFMSPTPFMSPTRFVDWED